jgi:hypothetical protein
MSIQGFIDNPLAYTKGHVVTFSGALVDVGPPAVGMQIANTYDNWAGAWKAEYYTPVPGQFTDFRFGEATSKADGSTGHKIGTGSGKMHTVIGKTVAADKGIRYLPWKADHMTFMEIDAAATRFFTGPLSGCAIYIGRAAGPGNYWAFHANRNAIGAVNNGLKSAMLMDTLPLIGGATVSVVHSCAYGQDYLDYGFVFGQKDAGEWKFYVADTRALGGGKSATVVNKLK